jgi:putative ABC transport system permease protein
MLANYFLIAIRNLWRNKVPATINIFGLAIGLACCMLILLYTKDELSYDRFHAKHSRIHRITARVIDDKGQQLFKTVKTAMVVGAAFKKDIPGIGDYTRLGSGSWVIRTGKEVVSQEGLYADANFFSVFNFPLVEGDARTALDDPHSVVLSEDAAKKYFGATSAVGRPLDIQVEGKFEPFIVRAIAKRCPENSSIKFDLLLPMKLREQRNPDNSWLNFNLTTFLLLQPGADPATITRSMSRVFAIDAADQLMESAEKYNFHGVAHYGLQPFAQIHLDKEFDAQDELKDASSPAYSWVLSGIAVFIIVIACINFINLTMAASLKRGREIGIRKVIGGSRAQLVRQFLGESFITCFIAFVIAVLLTNAALPLFNELANKRLSVSYLLDGQLVAGFATLFLFTGFAAGFYPALVLSGFRPVQTLYQRIKLTGRNYLSKTLLVIQFTLSALLIISSFFLYQQLDFLTNKDLGYNDRHLVVFTAGGNAGPQFSARLRQALAHDPAIQVIGEHNRGRSGTSARVDGKELFFDFEHIDENYLPALQLRLAAGRNFSPQFPADSAQSVLVNETFVARAGWKDPIGKTVEMSGDKRRLTVVGVVKDYYFRPLNERVGAQLFAVRVPDAASQFFVRISPDNTAATLKTIETAFKRLMPFYPWSYTFRSEQNRKAYAQQDKWKQIVGFAALLTIFLSCVGLLGLTVLSARQRTKEFGIRKVLGASVSGIVRLASVPFIGLVLLANGIAIPIGWWAVNKWLQNFAYHIEPRWWVFAAAVLMTVLIAGLTVGIQSIRAAVVNPVKSLRSE